MRIYLVTIFILTLSNCSFDSKTGIWNNSQNTISKEENKFKQFKKLYIEKKLFNDVIPPNENLKISLEPIKKNTKWYDEFYQNSNNLENFVYKNLNKKIFKSKKLSRYKIKDRILFDGGNFLFTDVQGNIIVYSISDKKITLRYNFYKKKYKKIKKILNIVIQENIVYVSDNIGYLYAIDYVNNKFLWAKNFKIPFRSNIKIKKNYIVVSDINNSIYFIDKSKGQKLKVIPTEETRVKNEFINSIALNNNSLFYLNTYGSIYSIDNRGKIDWFLNLSQSSDKDTSNLFNSNPLLLYENKVFIATDKQLHIFNSISGATNFTLPISTVVQPLVSKNNLFLITKDNLLVCININEGKILYSIDINQEVADFLDTKKKSIYIKSISLLNNNIFVFLDNSYYVKFDVKGKISGIERLPERISSLPIFINGSIIYLNNKNKLVIID